MNIYIYIYIYMWPVAMALVFKVLMMIWMHPAESTYQLVELFSGQGEVSRVFRAIGRSVGSYDKELGGKCMDFTLPAGFACGAYTGSRLYELNII